MRFASEKDATGELEEVSKKSPGISCVLAITTETRIRGIPLHLILSRQTPSLDLSSANYKSHYASHTW